MPLALGPVLARGVPAGGLVPSAAHRLLIWDFVSHAHRRTAGARLGHGGEPRGARPRRAPFPRSAGTLRPRRILPPRATLPSAELLPLHPHNGALQLWLELGLPGALLGAALAVLLGLAAARAARPAVATAVLGGRRRHRHC